MPEFEPKSRNEALLNAIANGQESTIVPQSRNEFLLMEVARTVAEGGGGNPNRVETITGTLAQPFADYDLYASLLDAVTNGNASAQIEFVVNDVPMQLQVGPNVGSPGLFGSTASVRAQAYDAASVFWSDLDQGVYGVIFAYMVGSATHGTIVDISEMASSISSTLTIIWHPLPEA